MSVLSYLQARAAQAVLAEWEKASINTSIATLSSRLNAYFTQTGDSLSGKFQFGSSTRGTILPRSMDSRSDIDYMIVFEKGGYAPQTYLNRLKRFVEARYATSEIYQSHPTVVLELNHIKFDLVPALHSWGTTYEIPSNETTWQSTNPNDFNSTLEAANKQNGFLIKPTARLVKLWNASNSYVFNSYELEKWIASLGFYGCANQKDYLFYVFEVMSATTTTQWRTDRINRAKRIVADVKEYERQDMPYSAESEVKKLIPES